jgi:glycine cleavage system transcriptional repressor
VNRHTIITAIGEDRPGLVEEVSEFVFQRGGSIQESRMANMLGQFAIAMLVCGTKESIDRITGDIDILTSETAIDVRVTPVVPPEPEEQTTTYLLVGRALDQPGLVHQIADVLRRFEVNIEALETTLEPAPVTGAPIFAMDLVVTVPVDASLPQLIDELGGVCEALNIDWTLTPLVAEGMDELRTADR